VGALGELRGLAAPSVRPGLGAFVEGRKRLWGGSRALRGSFAYATGTANVASSNLDLTWVTGRLDACPFHVDVAGPVTFDPCAAAEVGSIAAGAKNATNAQNTTRAWVAPGVALRLEGRISSFLFFELDALALVPVVRDSYTFTPPGSTAYRAPPLTLGGAFGIGFTIW
jgi:hypothetical protein